MFLDYKEYKLDIEASSILKASHPTAETNRVPFLVNEIGIYYAKAKYYTTRWKRNDYLLIYTIAGKGELKFADRNIWNLTAGSVAIIDCNQYHFYHTSEESDGNWTFYWAHIGGDFVKPYYELIHKNVYKIVNIGIDYDIIDCFKTAFDFLEYQNEDEISYCVLSNLISAIFTKMVTFLNKPQVKITASPKYKGMVVDKNMIRTNDAWVQENKNYVPAADETEQGPWIRFEYSSSKWINKIIMFDISGNDYTQSVAITFSDGSCIEAGDMKHQEENVVAFEPKNVMWVQLNITQTGGIDNPCFSRVQIIEVADLAAPSSESAKSERLPQEFIVQQAIHHIKNNYEKQITIDDLAHRFNISKYYFIRLFNKYMQITPYRYLTMYRVNEAKKLLRTTNYTIKDIGCAVGLADISNFLKIFFQIMGMTPTQYRNSKP